MTEAEQIVRATLERSAPSDWQDSGRNRSAYLDLAETIVRAASDWLDETGAIIDPVEQEEWGQTSARFVSSAACLLAENRCADLRPHVLQAMDRCCSRLSAGEAQSPDFWLRELMTAFNALAPHEAEHADIWAQKLSEIVPEEIYWQVEKDDVAIEDLHNWTVYAAAGEAMRAQAGLAPEADVVWGTAFFDKYMPAQLQHFTDQGMYRDPGDPLTYDLTTRIQFALALEAGAGGPERHAFDAHLRNAGFATLLLVSPEGFVPFGGRSSQYNFQEVMVSLLCELEARRWKTEDPRLAGAFKRQARRSLQAIEPWFALKPFRHIKNSFPPEQMHGFDPYGKYAVYSLLTASFCVLAAQYADDSIPEHPVPAEIGGYVFELTPAFHKIIATQGGSQIVIDTQADPHYDATGLGRVCQAGIPLALCLGMPFSAEPNYTIPEDGIPDRPVAIGPEWQVGDRWVRLAEQQSAPQHQHYANTSDGIMLNLEWNEHLSEHYLLRDGELVYTMDGPHAQRLIIPVLVHDGIRETDLVISERQVDIALGPHRVRYCFDEGATFDLDQRSLANRHGRYQLLTVSNSRRIRITFPE